MRQSKTNADETTTNGDDLSLEGPLHEVGEDYSSADQTPSWSPTHEGRIGRYRIEKLLGSGGFGFVFLAQDDQLDRAVAIKVPSPRLVTKLEDAGPYMAEARNVARLDHPNIVPVYDVGTTAECPCYIVSRYVEGSSLAAHLKDTPVSFRESACLVRTIAEALHFAHEKGLVHRDVKPGNVMLGSDGTPFLIDFGLALREEHIGKGPRYVGTPSYMSPEQARGEGHRVDRRSDVYSLGCMLYVMLTGCRPFDGKHKSEILEKVAHLDPESPRQINASIPVELERICNKAMRKRSVDRYPTAQAMADDLGYCLEHRLLPDSRSRIVSPGNSAVDETLAAPEGSSATFASNSHPLRIIPKGLRSFDQNDSDFFLELLPGPRDRMGLPDSLRFWKGRVEEKDADKTFPVGLVYGPSGCGKSSLIKAGLLPRLDESVISVFVEATPEGTETHLLQRLRKLFPDLDRSLDLPDTLATFRRQDVRPGKKLLIVFDQFEQWLHTNHDGTDLELVRALRQCDGGRLQCLILVRDDFWLAVSRFMRSLEIEVIEGWNWALVDLFDPIHATKVLNAFGVAYNRLPSSRSKLGPEQKAFLEQAVEDLSQEGKVVPVRLAAFAEMFKGKPWTPAALQKVGGSSGIGVSFLEETFQSSSAPPQHRLHQKAAQAVLRSMLPEAGTQIKAPMRSESELMEVSGYADRPKLFQELVRMLDRDIRLITPAEPVLDLGDAASSQVDFPDSGSVHRSSDDDSFVSSDEKHYQLTHDYLVRPIRDWLTRKQRTTARGRAELRLAERAAVWQNTPNRNVLPGFWETLQIRWFTAKDSWTASEKEMMHQATRYYAWRCSAMLLTLALLAIAGREGYRHLRARGTVRSLLTAKITEVPMLLAEVNSNRGWVEPILRKVAAQPNPPAPSASPSRARTEESRRQLNASLGLLQFDDGELDYLQERLLAATPPEMNVMIEVMGEHKESVSNHLWSKIEQGEDGTEGGTSSVSIDASPLDASELLRAGCFLAAYDRENTLWETHGDGIASALLQEPPSNAEIWIDLLAPASPWLIPTLTSEFRNSEEIESARVLAARALAKYAHGDQLVELILDADASQFLYLFPATTSPEWPGNGALLEVLGRLKTDPTGTGEEPNPAEVTPAERLAFAKRRRNAAIALLRMREFNEFLPLLELTDDPTTRTKVMLEMREFGTPLSTLLECFDRADSVAQQQALLVAAAFYAGSAQLEHEQHRLRSLTEFVLQADSPASIRSSAEWLLAQLKLAAPESNAHPPASTEQSLSNNLAERPVLDQLQFSRISVPARYTAGSPKSEEGREVKEILEDVSLSRSFEITTLEITVEQFRQFLERHPVAKEVTLSEDSPVNKVSWLKAIKFCRWLSDQTDLEEDDKVYPPLSEITEDLVVTDEMLAQSGFRLPTDAEWEYACRAGSTTPWFVGNDPNDLSPFSWYSLNSEGRLHPVGRTAPNPFGLFDILGNTAEWCHSTLAPRETSQTLRGGKYTSLPNRLRSAQRFYYEAVDSFSFTGFRVARTVRVREAAERP